MGNTRNRQCRTGEARATGAADQTSRTGDPRESRTTRADRAGKRPRYTGKTDWAAAAATLNAGRAGHSGKTRAIRTGRAEGRTGGTGQAHATAAGSIRTRYPGPAHAD